MATVIKKIIFTLFLMLTANAALAHTIYASNDIPLLDNRFRIDPYTEQITFILNHSRGPQTVVLVRPNGSKLYYQRHPDSVAWVAGKKADIITIANPVSGPWQAVADLDKNNRIKLVSSVELKTGKLPLKLYAREYITTQSYLYLDDKLMTDSSYLSEAKLSVALIGVNGQQISLFKDDGQGYDALPFDGTLTARMYIDLQPGRYLLSIRTKNNVFMRSQNKDAVVFATPITYKVNPLEYGSKEALFTFKVDSEELDPASVIIDGVVKNTNNKIVAQLIAHSADNISAENLFTKTVETAYGDLTLSGKAFATTRSGREIELQLPERQFWMREKIVTPPVASSEAVATDAGEQAVETSIWENSWVLISIAVSSLLLIAVIIFIVLRLRRKKKQAENSEDLDLNELSLSELQPESIVLDSTKK